MDDVKLLTTLKILIIGESNVGKSRYDVLNFSFILHINVCVCIEHVFEIAIN